MEDPTPLSKVSSNTSSIAQAHSAYDKLASFFRASRSLSWDDLADCMQNQETLKLADTFTEDVYGDKSRGRGRMLLSASMINIHPQEVLVDQGHPIGQQVICSAHEVCQDVLNGEGQRMKWIRYKHDLLQWNKIGKEQLNKVAEDQVKAMDKVIDQQNALNESPVIKKTLIPALEACKKQVQGLVNDCLTTFKPYIQEDKWSIIFNWNVMHQVLLKGAKCQAHDILQEGDMRSSTIERFNQVHKPRLEVLEKLSTVVEARIGDSKITFKGKLKYFDAVMEGIWVELEHDLLLICTGQVGKSLVKDALDLEYLCTSIERIRLVEEKLKFFTASLRSVLWLMHKLAAPVRDTLVIDLQRKLDSFKFLPQILGILEGIFELLHFMRFDMVIFHVYQNRVELIKTAVQREKIWFDAYFDGNYPKTCQWLLKTQKSMSKASVNEVWARAIVNLIGEEIKECNMKLSNLPETLILDVQLLKDFRKSIDQFVQQKAKIRVPKGVFTEKALLASPLYKLLYQRELESMHQMLLSSITKRETRGEYAILEKFARYHWSIYASLYADILK